VADAERDKPVSRYALLQQAIDQYAQSANSGEALAVVEALAEEFELAPGKLGATTLRKVLRNLEQPGPDLRRLPVAETREAYQELGEEAVLAAAQASAGGEFSQSVDLLKLASVASRKAGDHVRERQAQAALADAQAAVQEKLAA
jgi:hypothetical protein